MPENKKISDLADDSAVTLSDFLPIVSPGSSQTKKTTIAHVLSLTSGGGIADAVFQNDFEVNLPANDTGIPNGTVISAGESIGTFLEAAFRKASHPVYIAPAAALSGVAAPAQVEVGTPITIVFTEIFTQHDGGVEVSRVINKNGFALTPVAGVFGDTINAGLTALNYQAVFTYADGTVKNDSLGNPDATGQINAGSALSNILSYQGTYKVFFGATDVTINPGNVRSLLGSIFLSGATIDFPTGSTYRNFYIAVPPGHTLQTFVDFTSSSASLLGSVTSSSIAIVDGGTGTLNYTLYKLTTGTPYSGGGDLFKFNIG